MAELTAKDRLQPALLDRLTDDAPSNPFEARERRVVSAKQLRRGVLRDLSNLLNATRLPGYEPKRGDGCSAMGRTVLNYGLPDFTGKALSNLDSNEISDWIAEAIRSSRESSAIAYGFAHCLTRSARVRAQWPS